MKRQVTYAKLHGTDAFIPGVGQLGTTLPALNKTFGLKMYWTDAGLELDITNSGRSFECVIPHANVQIAIFAPEEPKPTVAKAS